MKTTTTITLMIQTDLLLFKTIILKFTLLSSNLDIGFKNKS